MPWNRGSTLVGGQRVFFASQDPETDPLADLMLCCVAVSGLLWKYIIRYFINSQYNPPTHISQCPTFRGRLQTNA